MAAVFKITLDFEGMTWGHLRKLVQMTSDYPANEEVEYDLEPNDLAKAGIEVWVNLEDS